MLSVKKSAYKVFKKTVKPLKNTHFLKIVFRNIFRETKATETK